MLDEIKDEVEPVLSLKQIEWLINRVEELEKSQTNLKVKYHATKESHYKYSQLVSVLEQQNNRYHELLRKSLNELKSVFYGINQSNWQYEEMDMLESTMRNMARALES